MGRLYQGSFNSRDVVSRETLRCALGRRFRIRAMASQKVSWGWTEPGCNLSECTLPECSLPECSHPECSLPDCSQPEPHCTAQETGEACAAPELSWARDLAWATALAVGLRAEAGQGCPTNLFSKHMESANAFHLSPTYPQTTHL